jgi:hypothetical protein
MVESDDKLINYIYPSLFVRNRLKAFYAFSITGAMALPARSWAPKRNSSHGMGSSKTERNANTLPAQCIPRFWYIWSVNNGNTAPNRYLIAPFAARAMMG